MLSALKMSDSRENLLISPSLNHITGMLMWTFFFSSSTQPLISARYATNAALILSSSQRMLSSRPFSYISHHRVTTMHICGSFIYFLFFIYFNCHMPVEVSQCHNPQLDISLGCFSAVVGRHYEIPFIAAAAAWCCSAGCCKLSGGCVCVCATAEKGCVNAW